MRSLPVSLLLAIALCPAAGAGEVQVAVAANFAAPLARLAQDFGAATGHRVKASAGSTGRFRSQIVAGAPFEVLLAADEETPRKLAAEGHGIEASRSTYAIGRLVLWSAQADFVDDQGAVLATPRWRYLALANPKLAPYGAAALEVLRARGLGEAALVGRIVTGESIAQAFQFVATGNAELGFVALSQVAAPGQPVKGSYWLVPQALYTPIRQDALLLEAGAKNPAAVALLAYLKTPAARAVIQAYGYGL